MKVNHRFIPTTFRLNPWKGVKGSVSKIFSPDRIRLDVDKLLYYVYKQLADSTYSTLKKQTFTLVNVFNPDTKHSVGYLDQPPKDVIGLNTGLVLTFALTSRPIKKAYPQPYTNHLTNFNYYWGSDIMNPIDYLTVNVQKDFLNRLQFSRDYHDDLVYIYNVVGMATKNWVQNPTQLVSGHISNTPMGLLKSSMFDKTLVTLFKTVKQDSWQYNSKVWEECSNLLSDKHFAGRFPLYFSVTLYDRVSNRLGKEASHFVYGKGQGTLSYFIEAGVRRLHQMIKTTATSGTVEDDLYATISLILSTIESDGLGFDNDQGAWDFIQKLSDFVKDEDSDSTALFQLLAQTTRVARSLIDQNDEEPLIQFIEEIL